MTITHLGKAINNKTEIITKNQMGNLKLESIIIKIKN